MAQILESPLGRQDWERRYRETLLDLARSKTLRMHASTLSGNREMPESGVEQIIVVGGAGEMSSNTAAVALAESYANLYATVGMHPHDAKQVNEPELRQLKKLSAHSKVIAVGETGVDYYYNHSPREVQRQVFAQFIALADETELPLVVHERDATHEAADLLRVEAKGKLRGVIHWFTGDYVAARNYLDLGFYLSFLASSPSRMPNR